MTVITVVTSLLHFSACFFKVNSADVRADKCKGESGEVIFAATIAHKENHKVQPNFAPPIDLQPIHCMQPSPEEIDPRKVDTNVFMLQVIGRGSSRHRFLYHA